MHCHKCYEIIHSFLINHKWIFCQIILIMGITINMNVF